MSHKITTFKSTFASAFMVVALAGASTPGAAATFETLVSVSTGVYTNVVLGPNGGVFGTTYEGGTPYAGTMFVLTAPGSGTRTWRETTLYTFGVAAFSPLYPFGNIIRTAGGNITGTTPGLGSSAAVAYTLLPPVAGRGLWQEQTLYNFDQNDDVDQPNGLIQGPDGSLYGTSIYGGTKNGGSAFKLTRPNGTETRWTETLLHSFGTTPDDGKNPYTSHLLMDAQGDLYGTTEEGGTGIDKGQPQGRGTVFKLAAPKAESTRWTETLLYSFPGGRGGAHPFGGLVTDRAGNLYGTTSRGCAATPYCGDKQSYGLVFELSPPAAGGTKWTETSIHIFTGLGDGGMPYQSLAIDANGIIYGTTATGGDMSALCRQRGDFGDGCGLVFELKPPTSSSGKWQEIVLHEFHGGTDGLDPTGDLTLDKSGAIYGETGIGGVNGGGTVFKIVP